MLLHVLESSSCDNLISHISNHPHGFAILGSSGTGKTRTIFEFLSQNYGLYFSFSSTSENFEYGNSDLMYFINRLEIFVVKDFSSSDNFKYVNRFVKCMVAARLYMLCYLRETYPVILTPKLWLFIQLFPDRCAKDFNFFSSLIEEFRKLSDNDLSYTFSKFKNTLNSFSNMELKIFLDESQVAVKYYEVKFKSPLSVVDHSLFYAIGKSFKSCWLLYLLWNRTKN